MKSFWGVNLLAMTALCLLPKFNGHGGQVYEGAKEHTFEVVFYKDEVRLFTYNMKGQQLNPTDFSGQIVWKPKKKDEVGTKLALEVAKPKSGSRGYLFVKGDFKTDGKTKYLAQFELKGLKGEKEKEVKFEVPFQGTVPRIKFFCPGGCCGAEGAVDPGECPNLGCKTTMDKKVEPENP